MSKCFVPSNRSSWKAFIFQHMVGEIVGWDGTRVVVESFKLVDESGWIGHASR